MTASPVDDPVTGVDELVAAIAPRLPAPVVRCRDAVLVVGPWLSGASAVAAALRGRLPELVFVEAADLADGEAPAAVVFVVSAAAALTESDCALLDRAAACTDAVIGVVSKIDAHLQWRQLLDAARGTLAARAPRYRGVPWVGAAAAPAIGEPRVDDLVAEVAKRVADTDLRRRNRLRSWEARLQAVARRYDRADGTDRRARMAELAEQRDTALRQRRLARSAQSIALRGQLAQARIRLSQFTRNRCGSVRGELLEDVMQMTRRRIPGFEGYLRSRLDEVIVEVDEGAAEQLSDVAHELDLELDLAPAPLPTIEVGGPALKSRRLETQLILLLGAGFGVGVALTLSRLLTGPGTAGAAACAGIGLVAAVWVGRTRGLLRDRAVLERWVGSAVATLRSSADELVALRVLAAESALTAELAGRTEADGAQVAEQVAALDGELREQAAAAARSAAARDRELVAVRQALATVRAELGELPA
ncbi:MAG TPA: hypothetical protein VFR17_04545 [Mycobacterium sp.]|nr:hypothetical protein [Mycobacterium sp.]